MILFKKKLTLIIVIIVVVLGALSWLMYANIVPNPFVKEVPPPPQTREEFLEYISTTEPPVHAEEQKRLFIEQITNTPPPTPEEARQAQEQRRLFLESLKQE